MPPRSPNPRLPRLAMDARMLTSTDGMGVSSYARALRAALAAISPADTGLLCDRPDLEKAAPAPFGRIGRWLSATVPGVRLATEIGGPAGEQRLIAPDIFRLAQVYFDIYRRPLRVCLPGAPGLMHWTYPVPLMIEGWANWYTVHDVIPLLHPELTHISAGRYRRLLTSISHHAEQLVTVSAPARDDIVRTLGCAPERVIDCGLSVEMGVAAASLLPAGLEPGGFLLICGTVERRKNIVRALSAYRRSGVRMPLVIAGPDGWGKEEVAVALAETPGAIRLPFLERAAVRALMASARALLMPSLSEGFGLPVAEAMALGTPVGIAEERALIDTAGDAALRFDSLDVNDMAAAMRQLAEDEALCAHLAQAGRRNALRFTPDRFAARLAAAYADAAA